jgi:hypothetical protein
MKITEAKSVANASEMIGLADCAYTMVDYFA